VSQEIYLDYGYKRRITLRTIICF